MWGASSSQKLPYWNYFWTCEILVCKLKILALSSHKIIKHNIVVSFLPHADITSAPTEFYKFLFKERNKRIKYGRITPIIVAALGLLFVRALHLLGLKGKMSECPRDVQLQLMCPWWGKRGGSRQIPFEECVASEIREFLWFGSKDFPAYSDTSYNKTV